MLFRILYTINECNRLCNEYGLDAICVPRTIAAAMELYQRRMLSQLPLTRPEYCAARGWVNAFPTDETLIKLGLDACIGK